MGYQAVQRYTLNVSMRWKKSEKSPCSAKPNFASPKYTRQVCTQPRKTLQTSGLSHEIALLTAVNDYEVAKADIAKVIKDAPADFGITCDCVQRKSSSSWPTRLSVLQRKSTKSALMISFSYVRHPI